MPTVKRPTSPSIRVFAVGFPLLFSSPAALGEFGLLLWLVVLTIICRSAISVFTIPFYALGVELSRNPLGRPTLAAFKQISTANRPNLELNAGAPRQALMSSFTFFALGAASALVNIVAGIFLDVIGFPAGAKVDAVLHEMIAKLAIFAAIVIGVAVSHADAAVPRGFRRRTVSSDLEPRAAAGARRPGRRDRGRDARHHRGPVAHHSATYELCSGECLSAWDISARLSVLLGREVVAVRVAPEDAIATVFGTDPDCDRFAERVRFFTRTADWYSAINTCSALREWLQCRRKQA